MLKIKIAIPCKDGLEKIMLLNSKRAEEEIKQLENAGVAQIQIDAHPNNTFTLTQFGNKAINESKDAFDYLILMHADVDLSLVEFVNHLIAADGKYDVVGMAGTKKLFISQSPLTWFTGSHKYPRDRYGKIVHNHDGKMLESFFNVCFPEVSDTDVLTIDGLLMCLNKKTMQNEKARFDEQFTYDFYDLDFCLNVQTNTDLKIGVFVQQTIHQSLGKSVLTEEYLIPERKFRMKWNSLFSSSKKADQ